MPRRIPADTHEVIIIGGRALGTKEDGFLYDYFPIGLTPVRGHRLELLATELGLDRDHFKVRGPQKMAFGYRPPAGRWRILNNVNIPPVHDSIARRVGFLHSDGRVFSHVGSDQTHGFM